MTYVMFYYLIALAPPPALPVDTADLHLPPVIEQVKVASPGYYSFIGSYQNTSTLNALSPKNLSGTVLDIIFYLNEKYKPETSLKLAYIKVGDVTY